MYPTILGIRLKYKVSFIVTFTTLLLLSSCNITRNVPKDKYLLDKSKITIDNKQQKNISPSDLSGYVRQKPNKKILLFRFHLRIYNMARDRVSWMSLWLRTIGEEPVILDTMLTAQTTENLQRFLVSKGYHSSRVADSIILKKKKKAEVYYTIKLGDAHVVNSVGYVVEDTIINRLVLLDSQNSLVKKGAILDMETLRSERTRIEGFLKEKGYFFFSSDFITYDADTTEGSKLVDLKLIIRNRFKRNEFGERIVLPYKKYAINDVFIYPNYDPIKHFNLQKANLLDTVYLENETFIFSKKPGIKLDVVSYSSLIKPGDIYSESAVLKTFNNLSSLRLFRMVNIYFEVDNSFKNDKPDDESFILFDDSKEQPTEKLGKVNCFIQLTPHTLQSYQTELVATNSSSDIGLEANLNFQHKNLFKGAEVFDTKLRGMLEFIKQSKETNYRTSTEFGGSVGISFPRFLSPFAGKELTTKFSPRTQLSVSYSYSDRPDYTRTVASMNFAYNWKDAKFFTYTISPVEVSMVNIFAIDPEFYSRIENTYQANSFVPQLITSSSYSIIFSNQTPKKLNSYAAIRFNVESSGNILRGLYYYTNSNSTSNTFQLLGIDFSQFVRSEINAVYNQIIDPVNSFVYRFYSGAAYPYGNSKAIPFEKKFFSGGSSGVRGWHARSLGPGTYSDVLSTYPNQSADIKIEANIEYRFKVIEMLEGALFADAGNIWAISSADERPGALFQLDKFYKQFALSTGLGIRLNLGFFVFRFDTGVKVFDPSVKITISDNPAEPPTTTPSQWIPFDRKYSSNDFVYHLGIGYPF